MFIPFVAPVAGTDTTLKQLHAPTFEEYKFKISLPVELITADAFNVLLLTVVPINIDDVPEVLQIMLDEAKVLLLRVEMYEVPVVAVKLPVIVTAAAVTVPVRVGFVTRVVAVEALPDKAPENVVAVTVPVRVGFDTRVVAVDAVVALPDKAPENVVAVTVPVRVGFATRVVAVATVPTMLPAVKLVMEAPSPAKLAALT